MFYGRIVQPRDQLFADLTQLTGDYAVLPRSGDDDYVRPATPETDCSRLNDTPTHPDDFTEPERWLVQGTVQVSEGRWWFNSPDALVKTRYNCYPSGTDFEIEARLEYTPAQPALTLPDHYWVEGIALFYGCCHLVGIGYARWYEGTNPQYGGVRFAIGDNTMVILPFSGSTRTVYIRRQDGQLDLDGLLQIDYALPEPCGVARITIRR